MAEESIKDMKAELKSLRSENEALKKRVEELEAELAAAKSNPPPRRGIRATGSIDLGRQM